MWIIDQLKYRGFFHYQRVFQMYLAILSLIRLSLKVYKIFYVVAIYLKYSLQVVTDGEEQLQLSTPNITGSFITGGTNMVSCESRKVGLSTVNSKGFFMFSTADASSTIDFSKA
jgi:hypothetical protein